MTDSSKKRARLALANGRVFEGWSCGADGEASGEVCFNTSLTGYEEVISDPSYAGQIVTMTYPHIGNYGVNETDLQNDVMHLRGLVVASMCREPSNFRSQESLPAFLRRHGVVAIEGVDTRALTRAIRDEGAMMGVISTAGDDAVSADALVERARSAQGLVGVNLAAQVSHPQVATFAPLAKGGAGAGAGGANSGKPRWRVAAFDCGIKRGILDGLRKAGCEVVRVPWDYEAKDVLAGGFDGVFFSNGPGDPQPVVKTYETVRELAGELPIFGICLGHQMISLAAGAQIEKLPFGHHGGNQPVMNLRTGVVEITAQNHGFGQVFQSLGPLVKGLCGDEREHFSDLREWAKRRIAPVVANERYGRIQLTHVNLNDGTPEGMAFLDVPMFSVQYHPEACPGPYDSSYLFEAFGRLMDGRDDFLDINTTGNRMEREYLSSASILESEAM